MLIVRMYPLLLLVTFISSLLAHRRVQRSSCNIYVAHYLLRIRRVTCARKSSCFNAVFTS
jgi:hypothetical protein